MKWLIDEEYSKMPKWSINKYHLILCDIYNRNSTTTVTTVISDLFLNYLTLKYYNKTWTLKSKCTSIRLWYSAFLHKGAALKKYFIVTARTLWLIGWRWTWKKNIIVFLLYISKPDLNQVTLIVLTPRKSRNKANVKASPMIYLRVMPTLLYRSFNSCT